MAVPSTFADLSTTPASNSGLIEGSDSPAVVDDHLRTLYAFVASISGNTGNGWTSPYLPASNPSYTGTLTGGTGVANLGSGQLYKDGSGNIGIGTTSPGSQLHINSSAGGGDFPRIRLTNGGTGTTSTDGMFVGVSNTSDLDIWNFEAGGVRIATDNAIRVAVTQSGVVGIGTTSPVSGSRVDVLHTGADNRMSIRAQSTYSASIEIAGNSNTSGSTSFGLAQNGAGTAFVYQRANADLIFGANGTSYVWLKPSGRVGIGTDAPTRVLHVVGDVRIDGTTSTSATAGGASALPAAPSGYLQIDIGGTAFKVPYYAA